ncbi:MAG TPA: MarR family transcriptional regulator [Candidatus Eremiobacteraeota bacterium]|nr:MAG: putative HTH-type transcriptional regulator YusO [bacterium ADurb.Bin363]HPZ09774.1 MarR family transcriptional regulator [Candidatus Eremiobacteraeota bacterium]
MKKNNPNIEKATQYSVEICDTLFPIIIGRVHKAQNLKLSHLRALKLMERNHGLKMKEIAETLSIAPSGATYIIDQLIKDNLVERYRVSEDRRVVYIRITEEGQKQIDEFKKAKRDVWKNIIEDLEERELIEFSGAIQIVYKVVLKIKEELLG